MMKIAWITPSSFIDVDLPIIAELQKNVQIFWQIVVYGSVNKDLRTPIESQLSDTINVRYEYVEIPYRVFDLRTLRTYCSVLKKAKAYRADLLYTSLGTAPFGPWVYRLYFPNRKTISACHNVTTPKGANQERYNRFYTAWQLRSFKNIQVFSESQRVVLINKYRNKNVLLAPLAIKDYGEPSDFIKQFDEDRIVFLFFGIISTYKRVDLLIEAAQQLFEQGYKNFKVKIAGSCKNWSEYASKIRIPELFDLRIERIPNNEVANLFANSDYFVMPYQDIAQSGAITVAYRYNLPIILSGLPQFLPFCEDGKTGFFFERGNLEDLISVMTKVLKGGKVLHSNLARELSSFVAENYSTSAITEKYYVFFRQLIEINDK